MRITDIHVNNFGHWNGLKLHEISEQITVIHGPNEAGKSTLLQFIRAILYGFSPKRHRRFVPPLHDGTVGGSLSVVAPNGRFEIRRLLPASGRLEDHEHSEITVRSKDGARQGSQLLSTLLAGIDDSIFHNVFAVGLSEIQHLGTLSDTDAAQQLYGLAMGGDRVSLMEVTRNLEASRNQIISSDSPNSEIDELMDRKLRLQREVEACSEDNQRWASMLSEKNQIDRELAELEQQKNKFRGNGNLKQLTNELRSKWRECQKLHRRLEAIGDIPNVSKSLLTKMDEMSEQVKQRRQRWEQLKAERAELKQKASGLKSLASLSDHTAEIDVLAAQKSRLRTMVVDLKRLETQTEEAEFELQAEMERSGSKLQISLDQLPLINDEVTSMLKVPAREAREAREMMERSEKEATSHRTESERLQRQLKAAVAKLGNSDLNRLHLRLQANMTALQQRLQLDSQVEKLQRSIKEVQKESHQLREREVLPWRRLVGLGIVTCVGIALLITGLVGGKYLQVFQNGQWMIFIGLAISMGGFSFKWLYQLGIQQELDACDEEVKDHRRKIKAVHAEMKRLDAELPKSSQPLVAQLQATENEILEIEEYLPLESERLAILKKAEAADRQKDIASEQLKDARTRWRNILRNMGLPESITPSQFRQLSEKTGSISKVNDRWNMLREQLAHKKTEFEQIESRIQTLVSIAQLIPESDDLGQQIDQLAKHVKSQRQDDEKRESLHRKWRQLGREQEKHAVSAKKIQQRRAQLMEQFGVVDEEELRTMIKRQARAIQIRKQRDEIAQQIVDSLDDETTTKGLVKQLSGNLFIRRLDDMNRLHDDIHGRLNKLYQRQGELSESIKSLVDKRDSASKKIELTEIDQRLKKCVERWQIYAATTKVLDRIRCEYESQRQPETLAEASGYLNRLTDGRYTRVWTPFGEAALCVDDQHGNALPVEVLSRGTREQVFLSLRMALVANYGRRGANLPLILDDVFVNFDIERAEAAVATIQDFARQGNQVLVFTCHDHIRNIFEDAGSDIRELPNARQLAKGVVVSSVTSRRKQISEKTPEPIDDGQERFYITADELAKLAYDDDFFGDDGTFYPLAAARKHRRTD